MNQDSIDRKTFKLNHIEEYNEMMTKHGQEFAMFSNWVFQWMESLPATGQWQTYEVSKPYLKPFIKVACLFMIRRNTLDQYWEFNENYTQIRKMKYEEKQTDRHR